MYKNYSFFVRKFYVYGFEKEKKREGVLAVALGLLSFGFFYTHEGRERGLLCFESLSLRRFVWTQSTAFDVPKNTTTSLVWTSLSTEGEEQRTKAPKLSLCLSGELFSFPFSRTTQTQKCCISLFLCAYFLSRFVIVVLGKSRLQKSKGSSSFCGRSLLLLCV